MTDVIDQQVKQERLSFFVHLTERCVDVLAALDNKDMRSRYAVTEPSGGLDCYLFSYLSDRTIFLEVMAKFAPTELENMGTHRFTSHPEFERIIEKYTRYSKKPNQVLEKSRPWDLATVLVMKIEALEPAFNNHYRRLLKRENAILAHIWHSYLRESMMDFEDMCGIPMTFDYNEVQSDEFSLPAGTLVEEIDLYGRLTQKKHGYCLPTLSYMTMEKLGPSLNYIIELMSIAAKKQSFGLNVSTAFKVFDQLLCRLLLIHRFGVVHNGICPQNVYFGRGICYNVVYVNNFRAATLVSSQPGIKPSINMRMAKDVRFASLNMMQSADMHPVHDIESAFYTLLGCLGPMLPWDPLLARPTELMQGGSSDETNPSSQARLTKGVSQAVYSRQYYASLRASKVAFWDSNIHLERYIANLMNRLTDRESGLFELIAGILQDLYGKVKRLLTTYGSKSSVEYCSQLCRGGSNMQLYTDLRKSSLMFFKFENMASSMCDLAFQTKQTSLAMDNSDRLVGWNLSEWCFNAVEVRPPQSAAPARLTSLHL